MRRWAWLGLCAMGLAGSACSIDPHEFGNGASGAAGSSSGGSTAAAANGGSGAVSGSDSQSGGSGAVSGSAGADTAPEKSVVGAACAADSECESGACRDEVCCASDCSGVCEACAEAMTGQPNGTCASATSGMDPHDDCETEAPKSCGSDGTCDGAGACRKYGKNQVCEEASCSGSDYLASATCDGSGTCAKQPAVSCGQYPCSVEGCETPCSKDGDCPAQAYCATDVCQNKKTDGSACSGNSACRSGACVDGVCCENSCPGTCQACSQAKTGQDSGRCVPVPAAQDPDNECAVESGNSCGTDGSCNGGGQCRVRAVGTTCGSASCSGRTLTPAGSCDGASSCDAGTPKNCAGNLTCASSSACRTTCSDDSHCVTGYFCGSGSCKPLKDQGATCSADAECTSQSCRDGVCCQSACSLSCQACSNATTGQADGICAARTASATKPCTSGGSTTCVNLTSNANNCGSCGNVCAGSSVPGTSPVCSSGTCSIACPAGTLGDGTNVCIPVNTIAAGVGFACGLLTDGHVKCWGDSALGLSPAGLSNVLFKSITAAPDFMCGIRDNGLAYCWGTNAPLSVKGGVFYALAAGDEHICGIKANRTLDCWTTNNGDGTDSPPSGTYKAVGSGSSFSCAIVQGGNNNGRGTCWGTQVDGGVFSFPKTSDAQTYTQMHGAGIGFWTLLPDGTTKTWGKTLFSAPSGTVFKTVADGSTQNRCGILTDSSLLCWGFPNDDATIAPSGSFKAVAMGGGFGCAVKTNGSVVCWGTNDVGQAPATVSGTFQGYW